MNAMSDPFSALPPGTPAPDFNLSLLGGGEFRLSQALTSGPVVLAFFKISCPVCQYSFPFFDRLARLLKPRGVAVIGISQDDEQNTALFRRTLALSLPLALDAKGYAVSRAYRLTNVPTVIAIAPEGRIVTSIVSWSKAELEALYLRYAEVAGKPEPLFQPGEQVAEFRPG